jgi:hypothetical protein
VSPSVRSMDCAATNKTTWSSPPTSTILCMEFLCSVCMVKFAALHPR